ncbi:MAG: PD-(D/E)XK nuclease family protein [Candidatus Dojkabacteria bacterium]|nr:PD-(D/E)XK nuclease family protein [Candidatus Dojkabacteria bacterium]
MKQKNGLTLSYSSIDILHQCPRKYFYRYIAKLFIPEETDAILFGKMIHEIIEKLKDYTDDEIRNVFKMYQQDKELREKYWEKILSTYKEKIPFAAKNIRNYFLYKVKNKNCQILYKEQEFNIDNYFVIKKNSILHKDDVPIHLQSKIDMLIEDENKNLKIIDFKTSKDIKDYSKQLYFYDFMLKKSNFYNNSLKNGEIVFLVLNNSLEVKNYYFNENTYCETKKIIQNTIDIIQNKGTNKECKANWEKKPSKLCEYCPYYKKYCNPFEKENNL